RGGRGVRPGAHPGDVAGRGGRGARGLGDYGQAAPGPRPATADRRAGYAELCLFSGQQDAYRAARRALLDRFGKTTDPIEAERTGRACVLRPAEGDERRRAVALAERAAAADGGKYATLRPFFLFVRGLAEYRQGRFEPAIATLRGK